MSTRRLLDPAQKIQQLEQRIRDLEARQGRVGTLGADSGWETVSKAADWGSGDVRTRTVGSLVVLTFSVAIGTTSSGDALCTLDADLRPSVQLAAAGVCNSSGGTPVQVIVETTGDVDIFYPAGPGSSNTVRATVAWFV